MLLPMPQPVHLQSSLSTFSELNNPLFVVPYSAFLAIPDCLIRRASRARDLIKFILQRI
jgi:hypothetical protein